MEVWLPRLGDMRQYIFWLALSECSLLKLSYYLCGSPGHMEMLHVGVPADSPQLGEEGLKETPASAAIWRMALKTLSKNHYLGLVNLQIWERDKWLTVLRHCLEVVCYTAKDKMTAVSFFPTFKPFISYSCFIVDLQHNVKRKR